MSQHTVTVQVGKLNKQKYKTMTNFEIHKPTHFKKICLNIKLTEIN